MGSKMLTDKIRHLEAELQNSYAQNESLFAKVTEYENLMIELYDQILIKN
jgi:hypothetical protein